MPQPTFQSATPYQSDVLGLPVTDLDAASAWYTKQFGMTEVDRSVAPIPTVILERNGVRIGFAINGRDASQEGAAVRVSNIRELKNEIESNGTPTANWRIDTHDDGKQHQVFFVVAPDGLCYYFHEPLGQS